MALGVAVGAVTGAVVGSAIASSGTPPPPVGAVVLTLPAGCTASIIGNVTYEQCSGAWYKPQYSGTTIQYIVVNPPR